MNKKKILSAVTLLTIATSSTIGMNSVFATKGNVQDIDKCVYFGLEDEEKCLTSEKLKELLESKGFTLKTELTGNVGTGAHIQVTRNGITYEYIVVLLGDVNGDGKISTQDISILRKHMIGKPEITDPIVLKAMNVDGNGKINTQDISKLRKMLIGSQVAIIPAEKMPEEEILDELSQAKLDAVKALDEYKVENYEEEDWAVIQKEINDAKDFITIATTIDEIEGCLDETKSIIDSVKTKQEKVEEAVKKAQIELEEELGKYTSTDYETDKWDNMTNIINTSKENLENLKTSGQATVADVEKIIDDARKSLKAVETRLVTAQKQSIERLDEILSDEGKRAQYNEENWNKIKDIVNSAKELINNYSSTSDMSTDIENIGKIEEDTFYEVNSVLTLEKELANLKTDKINDINSIATDTSKYSQEEQEAIANLKANAEVEINAAESFEEVEEKANEILAELSKYRTQVQKDAIDEINSKYVETDYYSEDWTEMIQIINAAKLEIDRALDNDVQTILGRLDTDLSGYETIAVQLEEAINAAKAELERIYSNSNKANYEEEIWNALKEELANQETIIEGQTTKTKVTMALENAKNKLKNDFKTIAQQTEEARQSALKQIDDAFANYVESDYSQKNWQTLNSYVTTAKESINSDEATIDTIETAVQTAISKMEKVLTIADEELKVAKTKAINEIKKEYTDKYKDVLADYDEAGKELTTIYNEYKQISKLTSIEEINAKKEDIITKMANVKKTAQKDLEKEFANNYDKADYYTADWEKIEKIVNDAISKIKESTTLGEPTTIKDTAITNMQNVEKKSYTLANAKNDAKLALDDFKEIDYEEVDWNEINAIIVAAKTQIDDALTPSAVTTIKDKSIADIEKYETSLQKVKKEIENISNNNVEIEVQIIEGQTETWCQANSIRNYLNKEISTKKTQIKTITKINDNTFAVNLCNVGDKDIIIDTVNFTCTLNIAEDEI